MAHPDFNRLTAEQHPEALGKLGGWGVLLHNTDVATHTLGLVAVGNMLVRGEVDLDEPVLVIWTKPEEDAKGADQRSGESANLLVAGSKRARGGGSEVAQLDGGGHRPKRQLLGPAP